MRGEFPDVYQYEDIPGNLRVQIVHIVKDAFGEDGGYLCSPSNSFKEIHRILIREYGVFKLGDEELDLDDEYYIYFHSIYNFFCQWRT